MIEPEMAFCDLADDMQCAEDYVRYCCRWGRAARVTNSSHGGVGVCVRERADQASRPRAAPMHTAPHLVLGKDKG